MLFGEWQLLPGARLKVAYSGGLDSHVLLHALATLRASHEFHLSAVYVDHGLQAASAMWGDHCAQVCAALSVPFQALSVCVAKMGGEGIEAAARRARYAALAATLEPGEFLVTAHQRDDQAETLLLQLLRGSGAAGIAAMPTRSVFSSGELLRPLLGVGRDALHGYANRHKLNWVEDPSNRDTDLRRNFLRQDVIPQLARHWPQASAMLARSATHAAETQVLLDELAQADLDLCRDTEKPASHALSVSRLASLGAPRQRNLLRLWLRQQGFRMPSARHLDEVLAQIRHTPRSQHARLHWPGTEIWRYRDQLVALLSSPMPDPALDMTWDLQQPIEIPGVGWLSLEHGQGQGVARPRLPKTLHVRLRRGGEALKLPGASHHHSLKKLLQSEAVPPWLRCRLPVFYSGDEIVAVANFWVCEPYDARPQEEGVRIVWEPYAGRAHKPGKTS